MGETVQKRPDHGFTKNTNKVGPVGKIASILGINFVSNNLYPDWKEYTEIFEKYGQDRQYRRFFESFRKEGDERILFGNKFSLLSPPHDGVNVVSGGMIKNGPSGVTYIKGDVAGEIAQKEHKQLFEQYEFRDDPKKYGIYLKGSKSWVFRDDVVDIFIDQFPGNNRIEKIYSFVKLFGLKPNGSISVPRPNLSGVGSWGSVILSKPSDNQSGGKSVRTVHWYDREDEGNKWSDGKSPKYSDAASLRWDHEWEGAQVLAFEKL